MSSKKYFDDVAQQWDEMRQDFFQESVRERAIAVADIQAGTVAADIGAGTGFVTAGLLQHGAQVIAVDQSEIMLTEMKTRFADDAPIAYRVGESEQLPLDDESIDAVLANMYLHHVERPPLAIREMVRALKPGGKLVITDVDEHNHEFLRTEQHDRWLGFKQEDIAQWFQEAGLKDVVVDCTNQDCCATSETSSDTADISIFIASGVKQ